MSALILLVGTCTFSYYPQASI